jgi:hypothetical protein
MGFQWSRSDVTIGDGFLRIAREQIGKAIAGAENSAESPERRVHEARRRCKKLRALLRLVRPDFAAYDAENGFVRDAARGLAQARDMRVARGTLVELMQWAGRPIEAELGGGADVEVEGLTRFAEQMRSLEARSPEWQVGRIDIDTLARGLKQTYQRGRWTRRLAEKHRTDDAFHEWRKYAKYHWNQLGLLEDCAQDVLPSAHKSAGDLAELLGLHHDLAVLDELLAATPEALGIEVDVGFAREAAARRQQEHEAKIAALGLQVFAETPRALKARFAAYLEGWMQREAAE